MPHKYICPTNTYAPLIYIFPTNIYAPLIYIFPTKIYATIIYKFPTNIYAPLIYMTHSYIPPNIYATQIGPNISPPLQDFLVQSSPFIDKLNIGEI